VAVFCHYNPDGCLCRNAPELARHGHHQSQPSVSARLAGIAREGRLRPHNRQAGVVPFCQPGAVRRPVQREGAEDESRSGNEVSTQTLRRSLVLI
jgi:hypothetical protein